MSNILEISRTALSSELSILCRDHEWYVSQHRPATKLCWKKIPVQFETELTCTIRIPYPDARESCQFERNKQDKKFWCVLMQHCQLQSLMVSWSILIFIIM